MEHIGLINAEGGPLLLADFSLAQLWRGSDEDSADYQRACNLFDSHPDLQGGEITIASGRGILWEMRGGGTADVFRIGKKHLVIIRVWPNDPLDERAAEILANHPTNKAATEVGNLSIASNVLTILWAVEDGRCFHPNDSVAVRPSGETAIADSASRLRTLFQSEAKIGYLTLNSETPCPPRGAVPVNPQAWIHEALSPQLARFAFGHRCDCSRFVGRMNNATSKTCQD